ncbi:hypothetical protein [Macrococcus capreoli]|uniref:hypothetical protein n=1 Tax=Macrococcus capreoli TaxID=2982690 RepID=UPI003F430688
MFIKDFVEALKPKKRKSKTLSTGTSSIISKKLNSNIKKTKEKSLLSRDLMIKQINIS